MATRALLRTWAWLVPMALVQTLPDSFQTLGNGSADRGFAWSLVLGVAAGLSWYWLSPRALAERLAPLAFIGLVLIVLAVIGGLAGGGKDASYGADQPSVFAMAGVLCGLVLSEAVHRWRHDAYTKTPAAQATRTHKSSPR